MGTNRCISPETVKETRRALADTGIEVLEIEILRLEPNLDVSVFREGMAIGAELGARFAVVSSLHGDIEVGAAQLRKLAEMGAEFGIKPALEFVAFRAVRTIADAARWVEKADHPNCGILVDTLHLSRGGGSPADLATVDARLLPYIHLCDADAAPDVRDVDTLLAEARNQRRYPGQGVLPLLDVLANLPANTPVSIEAPNRQDTAADPGIRASHVMAAVNELLSRYETARA
jgi:sugar phosphate isomerase/epimerase